MAGKTTKPKSEETDTEEVNQDALEGIEEAPAAAQPTPVMIAQLREPFIYYLNGFGHKYPAGRQFTSQEYDLNRMLAHGAQLDLIDPETNEVVADLNDL